MHSDTRRFQISFTQVSAGALAAVSAAVASSYLGVAGTIAGAAAGSVIATVAGAVYAHSLHRTNERLRAVVLPTRRTSLIAALPVAETTLNDQLSDQPGDEDGDAKHRWPRVAAGALIAFVAAMGIVTLVEVSSGGSLAQWVTGDDDKASTTIGGLVEGGSGETAPGTPEPGTGAATPGTTTVPTEAPTVGSSPTSSPSSTPTESAPTTPPPSETPTASASPSATP